MGVDLPARGYRGRMGLLSFMTGKSKPFDAVAAKARVEALRTVLPAGSDVSFLEPSKGMELTYLITTIGDRAKASVMLGSIADIVSAGDERWWVDYSAHDTADEHSTYSSFALPSSELRFLPVLQRAHDQLYVVTSSQTLTIDAADGSFTISDVPRGRAMATARAAIGWWEAILRDTDGRWRDSTLSVDVGVGIGVDGDRAEIIYGTTVEREPGARDGSDAEWLKRVVAAWNENLPALEAMLRLPVPADHEVEFSFTDDLLKPRLVVSHHETYDDDKAVAKELIASIRSTVADSKLKVG